MKKSFTMIDRLKEANENIRVNEKIKNKDGFDYNQSYENLVNNEKQIKQNEIEKRNLIRKEKERLLEEKQKEEEEDL